MQKQAPTLRRLLVMVLFALSCFGLLLFLWLAFGGAIPLKPKGYRFDVSFSEGTQLAVEADVRISGVPVGKVKSVEPDQDTGRSTATIEMDERYAPVREDARAVLRQKTLLGETYVELSPGTPGTRTVPEGGQLSRTRVSPTVELDEIFRAFDPKTRVAFQQWMQGQARGTRGRAQDISDALGTLDPFAEDTTELLRVLDTQENALRRVTSNTGEVFSALSERRGQLSGLITNAQRVFTTTAERDEQLRALFRVLPTFNREAGTTVRRLTRFARDTDPLVTQLRPAARELSPTLTDLSALAPDLRSLLRELDPLVSRSERGLPAVEQVLRDLRPALGEFDPVLKQLNPLFAFLGDHRSELRSFLANPVSATQARTPDGLHYLRTVPPLNPEALAAYPRRIGSNRPNPYMQPRGYDRLPAPLQVYESRHCGRGNPNTTDNLAELLRERLDFLKNPPPPLTPTSPPPPTPESLAANIVTHVFSNAGRNTPRVPCLQQAPFSVREGDLQRNGEVSQYPHVREAASSTARP